ncbi:MAG: hypothetical protein U9O94_00285 [Nanoarchaeota archaeon]|nr:hypothetical protein [Nanoarchaeota archaeon]
MAKCPYCGKELREHERYCDFCEQDISKAADNAEQPDIKKEDFKKDIQKLREFSKKVVIVSKNIKKKIKK